MVTMLLVSVAALLPNAAAQDELRRRQPA